GLAEHSGGTLYQRVHPALPPQIFVVDVAGTDLEVVRERMVADAARPFDLEEGPLLRMSAYRRGDDDWLILATSHHIGVDFWSLILLLEEVGRIYPVIAAGGVPDLPPGPGNYAEFVRRQEAILAGPRGTELQRVWREQLAGIPTVLELPTDRVRPRSFTGRADSVALELPADVVAGVARLAAAKRVTPSAIVLAARLLGVPSALHESNRVPGLAIRAFGRFAQRVYLPTGIRLASVRPAATRHVGLPVRREIVRTASAVARAALGLAEYQKVLVVLGGSQGSGALNGWVQQNLESFATEGIQVYCVTGLGKGEDRALEFKAKTGAPVFARFVAFSDRIAELLSAADLVVSRAGAGTLVELIRCATPAILVPYPEAADDHQRANAAFFERQGGGLAIEQTQLAGLHAEVLDVIFNDWLLKKFRANLQRMDRTNSLELMLNDLEGIAAVHGAESATQPATA
ncbi:MAG: glycosyltransferase, partial [Verrucomicrobiota bacterium]